MIFLWKQFNDLPKCCNATEKTFPFAILVFPNYVVHIISSIFSVWLKYSPIHQKKRIAEEKLDETKFCVGTYFEVFVSTPLLALSNIYQDKGKQFLTKSSKLFFIDGGNYAFVSRSSSVVQSHAEFQLQLKFPPNDINIFARKIIFSCLRHSLWLYIKLDNTVSK